MTNTDRLPAKYRLPEINMSRIPISGDAAGLVFALGSVAILLGMPGFAGYLLASLSCGALLATVLFKVHKARQSRPRRDTTLGL